MIGLARVRRGLRLRLVAAYRAVFARRRLYRWNRLLFDLSVRGLGLLNYENPAVSGEDWLLRRVAHRWPNPTVLDVGGNSGAYAAAIKGLAPAGTVYSFEPHPESFARLRATAARLDFVAINAACGEHNGRLDLYDYAGEPGGSEHATLERGVIEEIHRAHSAMFQVEVTTLDHFIGVEGVGHVHLLKIDTEGHEYPVLLGARDALAAGQFDVIQFEFNEMNVLSRRFLRDFRRLLEGFEIYRLLPGGLLPLDEDDGPLSQELFGYQNIVALRAGCLLQG